MRFEKHPQSLQVTVKKMSVENDYDHRFRKHGLLLPNTIRCLICGPSNCGKTNIVISLLESPNGIRFENVYVYSKSLQQPKYKYLEQLLSNIDNINYYAYSNNSDIISSSDVLPNSVFIFDDVACDKQDVIREYFSMGRHSKVDCLYLCQSYARIPKHLIRDNANFIIIFKQDNMNLRHIYNDHVNTDMTYDNFIDFCSQCWKKNFGFAVIDKDSTIFNGRYRRGFNEYMKEL